MPSQSNVPHDASQNQTGIATLVAIFAVPLGLIPAFVVVAVYTVMFKMITGDDGGIGFDLFAQILWGLIAGGLAISITRYFFKRINENTVRFTTLIFYGSAISLLSVMRIVDYGFTPDFIRSIFNIFGLHLGLQLSLINISGRDTQ